MVAFHKDRTRRDGFSTLLQEETKQKKIKLLNSSRDGSEKEGQGKLKRLRHAPGTIKLEEGNAEGKPWARKRPEKKGRQENSRN